MYHIVGQGLIDDWVEKAPKCLDLAELSSALGRACRTNNLSREECEAVVRACNSSGIEVRDSDFWREYTK